MAQRHGDLFLSTLHDLHNEAPIELLRSLRDSLEHIRHSNPNSAQTAEACLAGLASDGSTLLHVLTAAYLINGGVMLKHPLPDETEREMTLTELEAELQSLTEEPLVASPAPEPPPPRARPPAPPAPAAPDTA